MSSPSPVRAPRSSRGERADRRGASTERPGLSSQALPTEMILGR